MQSNELSLKIRIAYLERMLYGGKSDRLASRVHPDLPGLFDAFFKEAMEEKAETIERMAGEIEAETQNVARLRRRSPPTPPGTVMKVWKSARPS